MAKGKRPFSSLLDSPDAKKAVQDALHAPVQLPTKEPAAAVAAEDSPADQPVPANEKAGRASQKKGADPKEEYQLVLVRKSVHRLLKLASAHYGTELREIASDAIAADPRIQEMQEKFG